jgi:membrane protease YdiL (CAAX protease family)
MFTSEENRNIVLFFVITFAFSWILWLPNLLSSRGVLKYKDLYGVLRIIGSFGPFVGAFSLTSFYEGGTGVRVLWSRGWHYENWRFFLIALFLLPFLNLLSLWLAVITEGIFFPSFNIQIQEDYLYVLSYFLFFLLIGGPFQEEFGWRGYVLDKMQLNWNALESSIILGVIWSLWHLPLFYIDGSPQINQSFINYTLALILISIIYTWLYNNSDGSILVVMIFHATYNMSSTIFPLNKTLSGIAYYNILLDVVVVIILVAYGPKKLTRSRYESNFKKFKKYERLIS